MTRVSRPSCIAGPCFLILRCSKAGAPAAMPEQPHMQGWMRPGQQPAQHSLKGQAVTLGRAGAPRFAAPLPPSLCRWAPGCRMGRASLIRQIHVLSGLALCKRQGGSPERP